MSESPLLAPVVGIATVVSCSYSYGAMVMPQSAESRSLAASGKVPLKSSREKAVQLFSMYCVQSSNWLERVVPVTSSVV